MATLHISNAVIGAALLGAAPSTASGQTEVELPVPSRQVHLDFHTSELIDGIGTRFDRKQWQTALQVGRVQAINVFAKCHHSWSYYPTRVGRVHPNLEFDLLGAQIEACHEIGVRSPIYFTVGWSANDAEAHPEWCARDRSGNVQTSAVWNEAARPEDPKPQFQWKWLCPAAEGPYHGHILEQVRELCERYPVDGFWFDIYHVANRGCFCAACEDRMRSDGVDRGDDAAVIRSTALAIKEHMRQLRDLIAQYHPSATVYFNPTPHVARRASFQERLFDMNTHQELEDLPTTWGGYDKLPIEAKFHLQEGWKVVAMSGKFHKAWGEIGGFKAPEAIKYEAAAMIAHGAGCNFGDQLHPSGELDEATYRNIGEAYRYVEQIEEYGPGGVPVSKLGLWLTLDAAADQGMAVMLLEMHKDFVIANRGSLPRLGTVVVPSQACLTPSDVEALRMWVAQGGRLLLMQSAALDPSGSRLLFDIGADLVGTSPFDCDYTVARPEIGRDLVDTPFLNYRPALRVRPSSGESLAVVREPYFSRTYGTYSSHANSPYRLTDSGYAAVVRQGNIVFVAHPLDRMYFEHGAKLHRDLVRNILDLLEPEPVLRVHGLPSSGRVSLLHQPAKRRYVAHLLYSPVLQRGQVKVIEDFPTIGGSRLDLRVPERIVRVRIKPQDSVPEVSMMGNSVTVGVPEFSMHTMVVFDY